tara:strand:- start:22 stop:663 length:642 start_codon:yes stop_codon:yes gene_type:complete
MLVIEENDVGLFGSFKNAFFRLDGRYQFLREEFYKSFSPRIMQRTIWCYDEIKKLKKDFKKIGILNSGYQHFQGLLWKQLKAEHVFLYNLDENIKTINWATLDYLKKYDIKIEQRTLDISIDKKFIVNPDLLVNLSCENTFDMAASWDRDSFKTSVSETQPIYAFSGTRLYERGHVNFCNNLEEFKNTLPKFDEVLYEAEREDCFFVIGKFNE